MDDEELLEEYDHRRRLDRFKDEFEKIKKRAIELGFDEEEAEKIVN